LPATTSSVGVGVGPPPLAFTNSLRVNVQVGPKSFFALVDVDVILEKSTA
jgi:hypothetical protein